MRAIVLLSGGLDSSVAAAICASRRWRLRGLCVDYGQRAARAEIRAAQRVGRALGFEVDLARIPLPGTSALTTRRPLPHMNASALRDRARQRRTARAVWVPNRNGVMLNLAAAHAEARGIDTIVAGFNREEAVTFPDNSRAYMAALNRALAYSTANRVRLVSPTAGLDKRGIVARARRLGFDLSLCWPCYEGGRRPCRRCESCARFARAVS